jgi:hypothetical protein
MEIVDIEDTIWAGLEDEYCVPKSWLKNLLAYAVRARQSGYERQHCVALVGYASSARSILKFNKIKEE